MLWLINFRNRSLYSYSVYVLLNSENLHCHTRYKVENVLQEIVLCFWKELATDEERHNLSSICSMRPRLNIF